VVWGRLRDVGTKESIYKERESMIDMGSRTPRHKDVKAESKGSKKIVMERGLSKTGQLIVTTQVQIE
jgi:hypothetical protein